MERCRKGLCLFAFFKVRAARFVRIGVDASAASLLKISAYKKDLQTVVVIINAAASPVNNLQLNGINAKSAESYTTTEAANLKKQNPAIATNTVSVSIPAFSVTTVVINQ